MPVPDFRTYSPLLLTGLFLQLKTKLVRSTIRRKLQQQEERDMRGRVDQQENMWFTQRSEDFVPETQFLHVGCQAFMNGQEGVIQLIQKNITGHELVPGM